jgi:hypothetical protein
VGGAFSNAAGVAGFRTITADFLFVSVLEEQVAETQLMLI